LAMTKTNIDVISIRMSSFILVFYLFVDIKLKIYFE
jgi:hypothetical protein